ncbi:DUF2975 domain-containing protein [Parafilimonas sp.]|uniref:DUF2975 domain-containing protein n=1 Tax=Parafilimonas sp. TaxID=1969739 RepID=UPI003F7F301A
MKIRTTVILQVLRLLALLAFVGFTIEAGNILISFIVSFFNPDSAKNIYKGLDLHQLKAYGDWAYYLTVIFLFSIAALKAQVWQKVLNMLSHLKMDNPFQPQMMQFLTRVSNVLIAIWATGFLYNILAGFVNKRTGGELLQIIDADNFLFMAGLVFIITQVFKRGMEIQSENELTV